MGDGLPQFPIFPFFPGLNLAISNMFSVFVMICVRVVCEQVVRTVSCGEHHVGAVSEVGVLYTWGRGAVEVDAVFGGATIWVWDALWRSGLSLLSLATLLPCISNILWQNMFGSWPTLLQVKMAAWVMVGKRMNCSRSPWRRNAVTSRQSHDTRLQCILPYFLHYLLHIFIYCLWYEVVYL